MRCRPTRAPCSSTCSPRCATACTPTSARPMSQPARCRRPSTPSRSPSPTRRISCPTPQASITNARWQRSPRARPRSPRSWPRFRFPAAQRPPIRRTFPASMWQPTAPPCTPNRTPTRLSRPIRTITATPTPPMPASTARQRAMIASSAPPTRSWSSGPRALPSAIASAATWV